MVLVKVGPGLGGGVVGDSVGDSVGLYDGLIVCVLLEIGDVLGEVDGPSSELIILEGCELGCCDGCSEI